MNDIGGNINSKNRKDTNNKQYSSSNNNGDINNKSI